MKILEGIYFKQDEKQKVKVVVLEKSNDSIKGINLLKLTEEEQKEFLDIVKDYEEKTKKFMKAFRHYKKDKFILDNNG